MKPQRNINSFGTFLDTVNNKSSAVSRQAPAAAPVAAAAAAAESTGKPAGIILRIVMEERTIPVKALIDKAGLDIVNFGKAIADLQKLDAVRIAGTSPDEYVTPGPNCDSAISLLS
ncbi:MAG TPA: hypothetical protein VJ276_10785 [Thermoanaerobaculia bacterium]|nr:hypothetical protein [Thermoanaerobaculia bacterium]